jgi:hypothetical protein
VWGAAPAGRGDHWRIAVADPRAPAENARPLTVLVVGDRAVSSSGRYARGFDVGGRAFSHIVDPRTGWPADHVTGVTVVAGDNATANALATILSVLPPDEGLALVTAVEGAEAILVSLSGAVHRSSGFAALEHGAERPAPIREAAKLPAPTPRATMQIDIRPRDDVRTWPYVAVWVTDTTGGFVRTIAVWGNDPRWLREISQWLAIARRNEVAVDAVTRGTRRPGQYVLEWNGLDDWGAPVKPGTYSFWLEVSFEDGPHAWRRTTVTCGPTPASAGIEQTLAFVGGRVDCSTTAK